MRVISLVPSVTETLSAWGVEPLVCTRYCERPDLRHVGGTKNPEVDTIVALSPDLVVLDRQENRREDAESLSGAGLPLLIMDVRSIDGLDSELSSLADAVDSVRPPPLELRPRSVHLTAFVPIWRRPWMTIGSDTYGSSLLTALGIGNVFEDSTADYPEVSLDEVAARDPDVVLAPSEPYAFSDAHVDELGSIAPVVRVDGQDLFWWGARTPAAIERLRAHLGLIS